MKFTLISGTNRQGSKSLAVTRVLQEMYDAAGVDTHLIDLRELPLDLLSPEAYRNKPAAFQPFVDAVMDADGLVVVVPEYNGSFPGVLKLFIDMLPFPDAFEKRPVAFVGVASGRWGALRPVEHLQGVFGYRNAFIFPERVFLPAIHAELSDSGFGTPLIVELIESQVKNFIGYCKQLEQMSAKALLADKS